LATSRINSGRVHEHAQIEQDKACDEDAYRILKARVASRLSRPATVMDG